MTNEQRRRLIDVAMLVQEDEDREVEPSRHDLFRTTPRPDAEPGPGRPGSASGRGAVRSNRGENGRAPTVLSVDCESGPRYAGGERFVRYLEVRDDQTSVLRRCTRWKGMRPGLLR
jgi:hypothetical protein